VKLRSYQRVYADNIFTAAFNAIVFALAPIWVPVLLIYLAYTWFTQPLPFCPDLRRSYFEVAQAAREAHSRGAWDYQLDREREARKLKEQLDGGKCRATPSAPK
jgi:hypothetical protein